MDRQDGEGVDKQVVTVVDILFILLLRTVLLAEETRPLSHRLLVDLGSCGYHAGRIPLHLYVRGAERQFTGLHVAQILIAPAGVFPLLELTVEEAQQGRVVHQFLLALQHLLPGQYLERA